jgi:uncharacterized protein (TIGR02271 family)
MSMTLIGLFDNADEAQSAVEDLVSAGLDRDTINIHSSTDAGSVANSLSPLGVPGSDAQIFTEGVRRGGTLLTARVDDAMGERAQAILEHRGAVDINERSAQWGLSGSAAPASDRRRAGEGEVALPVIEEELNVGKRQVERGGVRVYTNVSERPVEEQVRLREEHVTVDRHPVDRPATEADIQGFREGTIELTEMGEEAVVSKRARVIEEIVINKEVGERVETVRDTVRRTDVDVEQVGGGRAAAGRDFTDYETDYRNNYQSAFATKGYTYDQYAPAYRYGYNLASDERYRGRDWAAVEPDARSAWEQHNKGTWEEFKDAIRYSWDSVRGRSTGKSG